MIELDSRRATAVFALAAVSLAAACGAKDNSQQAAAAAPAREIQLAPTVKAEPQLNDAPRKTAASEPRKKSVPPLKTEPTPTPQVLVAPLQQTPQPAAPAPNVIVTPLMGAVPAGTSFAVHPSVHVCTSTHKAGDRFVATLNAPITGSSGVLIPEGSTVVLRVVESARSQNSKDSIRLVFDVVSVRVGAETYEVVGQIAQTAPLEKVRVQSTGDQAKKVGTGAAIGAIAGQILGLNTKSTVIGAVVGAAAGGAVAAGTADYDGCYPSNQSINITLTRPLSVALPK